MSLTLLVYMKDAGVIDSDINVKVTLDYECSFWCVYIIFILHQHFIAFEELIIEQKRLSYLIYFPGHNSSLLSIWYQHINTSVFVELLHVITVGKHTLFSTMEAALLSYCGM